MLGKGGGMVNVSAMQWKKSLQYSDLLVKDSDEPGIVGVDL